MKTDATDRRVGLVDLDDLAPTLEEAGYETISGPTIAETAQKITSEWSNGPFPILTADAENPSLYRWIIKVATHKSRPAVSVLSETDTPQHINHDAISVIILPATLGELAEQANLGEIDEAHASVIYPEVHAPDDSDDELPSFDDDWDVEPEQPQSVSAAHPSDDDDDWGDETEPVPQAELEPESLEPDVEQEPVAEPQNSVDDPYEKGLFNVAPKVSEDPAPAVDDTSSHPAHQDNSDLGELFATSGSLKARRCPVVICLSGTGGVGKSTASIQLATTAGAAGYRTVLVDADHGQGDLETYLRLNTSGVDIPTIADTVGGLARVRDVVLTADKITQLRPDNAEPVPDHLALVRAPDHRDTTEVGPERYLALVNKLREQVDLVIIDAPIIKSDDHTGVARGLVAPLMSDGGFGLSISDNSNPGMKNLTERLNMLQENGIDRRKMLITINAADPSALRDLDAAARTKLDGRQGIYVGTIGFDRRIRRKMNNGAIDLKNRQLDQVVYETLYRATGDIAFDLDFGVEHQNQDDDAGSTGFFGRLFGRKRR